LRRLHRFHARRVGKRRLKKAHLAEIFCRLKTAGSISVDDRISLA
jgi:hypothetical protein